MDQPQKVPSGLNILFSIWLIASPFLLGYVGNRAQFWNDVLVGAAVLIPALIRSASPAGTSWLSYVNAALGIWLIIAAFVLRTTSRAPDAMWSDIVVGTGFLVFGTWSATIARYDTSHY